MTTATFIQQSVKGATAIAKVITKSDGMTAKWCISVGTNELSDNDCIAEIKVQVKDMFAESYNKKLFACINAIRLVKDDFDLVVAEAMGFNSLYSYARELKNIKNGKTTKAEETAETVAEETAETIAEETAETIAEETAETIAEVREAINLQREAVTASAKYPTLSLLDDVIEGIRDLLRKKETDGTLTASQRESIENEVVSFEDRFFEIIK